MYRKDFFTPLLQGGLARNYGTVIPISNASKFSIPKLSSVTFVNQTAVGTPALSDTATLTSVDVSIKSLASETKLSDEAIADLPALDGIQMRNLSLGAYNMEGIITRDALKNTNSADGGVISNSITHAGGSLPPATGNNNIFSRMLAMVSALRVAYSSSPNCAWFMSKQAYQRALEANTSNILYFDPTLGAMSFFGYPVIKSDHLEAGSSSGHVPIVFGDMSMGLIMGTRQELTIGRYEGHSLGHVTYYGKIRSGISVWDGDALVKLVIGS